MPKKMFIEEKLEKLGIEKARELVAPYLTLMFLMHKLLWYVVSYLPWVLRSLFL